MENKEIRAKRKVLTGVVVSDKMNKTRTVSVDRKSTRLNSSHSV